MWVKGGRAGSRWAGGWCPRHWARMAVGIKEKRREELLFLCFLLFE